MESNQKSHEIEEEEEEDKGSDESDAIKYDHKKAHPEQAKINYRESGSFNTKVNLF